jgi:mannose-6-phosphate isomerase-like protein (cupin superfamily)
MKVTLEKIQGEIVKDNETYVLEDNNFLEHMTLSRTYLRPGMMTRGHSHENQEEVYIFTEGEALMVIGDDIHHAKSGDTFLIPKAKFHRVINKSEHLSCAFTCIFEKYDRSGDEAVYTN